MDNFREIRLASGTAVSEEGSEQSRALDREHDFPKVSPWPRGGLARCFQMRRSGKSGDERCSRAR